MAPTTAARPTSLAGRDVRVDADDVAASGGWRPDGSSPPLACSEVEGLSVEGGATEAGPGHRALRPRPLLLGWMAAVAVDLFLNAGLFSPLFDQAREPALLPDDVLFRRIPVAYLVVGVEVAVLAWLLDRDELAGPRAGILAGSGLGLLLGTSGVVWLWTAIEMTGAFVAAGVVVQVGQLGAAGAVLGATAGRIDQRRVLRWTLSGVVIAVVAAVVAQNLLN